VLRRLRSRQRKNAGAGAFARLAVEERVRVLDLGADDYVVKPVRLDELEARVRA
jgi:two-component system OmpR family response regulator